MVSGSVTLTLELISTGKLWFEETPDLANHAFLFTVVDFKGRFKAMPAYFLINKLNGTAHANLLNIMLNLLHEYNVHVHSVTYDGDRVNESMVNALGANVHFIL